MNRELITNYGRSAFNAKYHDLKTDCALLVLIKRKKKVINLGCSEVSIKRDVFFFKLIWSLENFL